MVMNYILINNSFLAGKILSNSPFISRNMDEGPIGMTHTNRGGAAYVALRNYQRSIIASANGYKGTKS